MKWLRFSIVPALACLAAFIALLPTTGADATMRIKTSVGPLRFVPSDVHIEPGDRIAFVNETDSTHTATCMNCPRGRDWSTGSIQPGQTIFVTFPDEGRFQVQDDHAPTEDPAQIEVGDPPATTSPAPSPSPSPSPV